ncbi:hypothetical protein CVT24_010825 [Panaeolus cyanescens]|uniref:F-box domain-containing protein n=1 Tax=Panaeolus cyanescens TaxID=181874 RepID=A0A409VH15_9AGAR|nr:hypothetical protein CVT24_010825 [Panaeolus cyanescens]
MHTTVIPLEIISSIIDILAKDGQLEVLKDLSPVCSFFRDQCRKHLFATIAIEEDGDLEVGESQNLPSILQFTTLISEHPGVAAHIRCLILINPADGGDDQAGLPEALSKLTNLSTLEIRLKSEFWSDILSECIQALSQHASFQHLILDDVAQFPINVIMAIPRLQHLELIAVELIEEEPLNPDSESIYLKSLAMTAFEDLEDGEPGTALELMKPNGDFYIDLSKLESFRFLAASQDSANHVSRFFQSHRIASLKEMSFSISRFLDDEERRYNYTQALQSWILPQQKTLRVLEFHSFALDLRDDPYLGLCQTLDLLEAENALTSLRVAITVSAFNRSEDVDIFGEQWRSLCNVLNKPGWKSLTEVSLRILGIGCSPRAQFAKLSSYFEPLTNSSKHFHFKLMLDHTPKEDIDEGDRRMSRLISEFVAVAPSIAILPSLI